MQGALEQGADWSDAAVGGKAGAEGGLGLSRLSACDTYPAALREAGVATVGPEDQKETDGSPQHGMGKSGGPGYQGSAR